MAEAFEQHWQPPPRPSTPKQGPCPLCGELVAFKRSGTTSLAHERGDRHQLAVTRLEAARIQPDLDAARELIAAAIGVAAGVSS